MKRPVLKEWTPPRPKEIYTETLRPNDKVHNRDYVSREGDMLTLIAEFTTAALYTQSAWKEAERAARAIVKTYLINSTVVQYFPKADGRLFDRVCVYEKYNLSDIGKGKGEA